MIIAEGGSTKLDIVVIDEQNGVRRYSLPGINPFYQSTKEMTSTLKESQIRGEEGNALKKVFYYGAGCAFQEQSNAIKECFKQAFQSEFIEVESDLLAAARGLLGDDKGIVAILGTGSNSGYYDGERIIDNVSSLGFMLGDEGSGGYLGKHLVSDILKGLTSTELANDFFNEYHTSREEIMENVYKKPFPNRYLAGFVPFIAKRIENAYINTLVMNSFRDFFKRNIAHYSIYNTKQISFVGGVAQQFKRELTLVASQYGFVINDVQKSPLEKLIDYHTKH